MRSIDTDYDISYHRTRLVKAMADIEYHTTMLIAIGYDPEKELQRLNDLTDNLMYCKEINF